MADDKMKPEDMVPQSDQQAHTEIAEREGTQGEQAQTACVGPTLQSQLMCVRKRP
jgi:hypothetical protein